MTRRYYPEEETEEQLDYLLNSGLTFIDNIRCAILEVEWPELEDDESEQDWLDAEKNILVIQHGLGYVPLGYWVIYKELESEIWGRERSNRQLTKEEGLWTEEQLSLQCNAPSQKAQLIVL